MRRASLDAGHPPEITSVARYRAVCQVAHALTGSAAGSFVNNGTDKAAGVIGNWGVANSQYEATGIFGAARGGSISAKPGLAKPPRSELSLQIPKRKLGGLTDT